MVILHILVTLFLLLLVDVPKLWFRAPPLRRLHVDVNLSVNVNAFALEEESANAQMEQIVRKKRKTIHVGPSRNVLELGQHGLPLLNCLQIVENNHDALEPERVPKEYANA